MKVEKGMEGLDVNELQLYSEFLSDVDKKHQVITRQLPADGQQGDIWTTASSWKEAAPKYEDLHAFMVACTPPADVVNEHRALISNHHDLLSAINIMLSSVNVDFKTVNDIIFKAGQSKIESANKQVLETLQQLTNKVHELMG